MPWIEVSISVTREATETAEQALEQLDALAVTLEDVADNPVLEPDPGTTPLWPNVHVRGLFDTGIDRQRVMAALQLVPGADRVGQIRWREVGDQDWERAWMARFQPMRFGHHLWIVPTGMEIPNKPENIEICLDPGLAFGTGTHPTTALCLEWLDGQDVAGKQVVDYGCGSGILGIASALKGAGKVICVDNDSQALEATAANAERNGVASIIDCRLPADYARPSADLVLANILAAPLISLAPVLAASVGSGGLITLSGLLEEQHEEVAAAYRDSCAETGSVALEGWLRLEFKKI
jgi:ribosomal protein L11 methyltransferase